MRLLHLALLSVLFNMQYDAISAQSATDTTSSALSVSGYVEAYYIYDFGRPQDFDRPDIIFSHDRANEVTINMALAQLDYERQRVRARVGLMAGTYANANYAAEPGVLRNIFEAYGGYRLSERTETWVDAGIFSSHLGFESAVGIECYNMTRSIAAELSPYYLAGVRLQHTPQDDRWYFGFTVANGWQVIQRAEGNDGMAVGHQVTFRPNDRLTLNSSSYAGGFGEPGSTRLFHDFYVIASLTDALDVTAAFDAGIDQVGDEWLDWYTPVLTARLKASERFTVAGRVEYFHDPNGQVTETETGPGLETFGYSATLDVNLMRGTKLRFEARGFAAEDESFFDRETGVSTSNFALGAALAVRL